MGLTCQADDTRQCQHLTALFTYNYDISTYSVKISVHLLNRCGPVRCVFRAIICHQQPLGINQLKSDTALGYWWVVY